MYLLTTILFIKEFQNYKTNIITNTAPTKDSIGQCKFFLFLDQIC